MNEGFKFRRVWSWQSVREVCIKCMWYTRGDNLAYDDMLLFVETHRPTDRNITKVAEDIYRHSDNSNGRTLKDVAFVLALSAVETLLIEED